jgi:hypothetical protein
VLLSCALLATSVSVAQGAAQDAAPAMGPRTSFWFGSYPDFLVQFDPVTDTVVKKVKFRHGMPWGIELSHDQQRFFVVTDQQKMVEVIDRKQGQVVDEHDFDEPGYIVRVRTLIEWPGAAKWFVQVDRIKREPDRFAFEPSEWLVYDVGAKKIDKRLKRLPKVLGFRPQVSPDGKFWHAQNEDGDLVVVDPSTEKAVATVDLHTPAYGGAGSLRVRDDLFFRRNKGAYRMLFTMRDPVQRNRTLWGTVDIDLKGNTVGPVQEWGADPGTSWLRMARHKKIAVASGGGGDQRQGKTRLATYDLTSGKKLHETFEQFRPRQSLSAIAPDGSKIYVGGAGSDFEVFDAELKKLKTVQFDGEIYGQVFVVED